MRLIADGEEQKEAFLKTLDLLTHGLHAQVSIVRSYLEVCKEIPHQVQVAADMSMQHLDKAIADSRCVLFSAVVGDGVVPGISAQDPQMTESDDRSTDLLTATRFMPEIPPAFRVSQDYALSELPSIDILNSDMDVAEKVTDDILSVSPKRRKASRLNSPAPGKFKKPSSRSPRYQRESSKSSSPTENSGGQVELVAPIGGMNTPEGANPLLCSGIQRVQPSKRMSMTEQLYLYEEIFDAGVPKRKLVDGVLNPNWWGRLLWDLFVIGLVVSDSMVLPFQLAYKDDTDMFDVAWLWTTTVFFAADIALSFLTAYVAGGDEHGARQGALITNKRRIAHNYFLTWFVIDVISTIPWGVFFAEFFGVGASNAGQVAKSTKLMKFLRFLRLVRMARLAKLSAMWERVEASLGSFVLKQSVSFTRVIVIMFCICHWNACIWWLVGQPGCYFCDEGPSDSHWTTTEFEGPDGPWTWADRSRIEQYVFCVYWTLGVMRTMPAEVTPVNLLERLYVMFFMFFAFSAFAICVASITHAFFKFSERSRGFEEEMSAVRMYLRKIKADPPIQMAVKNFLQFVYDQHFTHSKEVTPLKNLPNSLKSLLKFARLKQHLLKLSVFASLPDKAVFYISDIAEEHFVATGTCLSKKDHIAEAAWVVMCGVLSVQDESSNCVNLRLDVVDELCLLSSSNCVSPNTVIVSACSELLRVNQDQFFKCLQQHDHFLCARQETVFGCGCLDEKRVVTHGRGSHSVQDVSAAVVAVVS